MEQKNAVITWHKNTFFNIKKGMERTMMMWGTKALGGLLVIPYAFRRHFNTFFFAPCMFQSD